MNEDGFYDAKFVSDIVGLQNVGATCYFNSMIQALYSCPAFNKAMLKSDSLLAKEYCKHLSFDTQSQPQATPKIDNLQNLLVAIVMKRKEEKLDTIRIGHQEDMHEALAMFLELLGDPICNLFKVKHVTRVMCGNCKRQHVVDDKTYELSLAINQPIGTREDIEKYIKFHYDTLDDYKCENCKHTGGDIVKSYSLARIPEIIVLTFNKMRRGIKYFPDELTFHSSVFSKNLNYRVVAQVEHSGSLAGGHYNALCLRNLPGVMGPQSTFLFDDISIAHIGKFQPTQNTYVVFYHLI